MNQSNKKYIQLLKDFGVHTFLKETPNKLYNLDKNIDQSDIKLKNKELNEINNLQELALHLANYKNNFKKTSDKLVIFDGDENSKLMIIGEGSNIDEYKQGKLFIGRSGELLNKMLGAIKLNRENIYVTNAVPWPTDGNKKPTEDIILEFLPFLQRQIEIVKPSFIYLLGETATKSILSTPLSLEKLRGKWHKYKTINMNTSINVLVSYHPNFLLKSPNYKKQAWADLQMLKKKINEY